MARPSYLWIPSLAALALSACGGSADGFFSNVSSAGAGGSSQAGSASNAGSISSSGSPSTAGSATNSGGAGPVQAGSGGAQTGGANSGGLAGAPSSGGAASSGGTAGRNAGGSGATAGHAGEKGSAGTAGAGPGSSCNELIKQAGEQLEAARACRLDADARQCTGKVTNLCDCEVPVQRSESPETRAYLKTLKQIEDKNCSIACAAVLCASLNDAYCSASPSGVAGTCKAENHGPGT